MRQLAGHRKFLSTKAKLICLVPAIFWLGYTANHPVQRVLPSSSMIKHRLEIRTPTPGDTSTQLENRQTFDWAASSAFEWPKTGHHCQSHGERSSESVSLLKRSLPFCAEVQPTASVVCLGDRFSDTPDTVAHIGTVRGGTQSLQ